MHKISNFSDPSIMEPLDSLSTLKTEILDAIKPDIINDAEFCSIPILPQDQSSSNLININFNGNTSFKLMDPEDKCSIANEDEFYYNLRCSPDYKVKVVSIFGNIGDGKSYTMNQIFFNGDEVFKTSSSQLSCTIGVEAAIQHKMGVLCIDTEGFLGTHSNIHHVTKMLFKILTISDIVIFRARCDRLKRDMYEFLNMASKVYQTHFLPVLNKMNTIHSEQFLGPVLLIFHETRYTKPLESTANESAEDQIRSNFRKLNMKIDAFSKLKYIGVQTEGNNFTDFNKIKNIIKSELTNYFIRSPKDVKMIFKIIQDINVKFSDGIVDENVKSMSEQYFLCNTKCESCGKRCERSMHHIDDGIDHENQQSCVYQSHFDNKIYLCKECLNNGKKVIVSSKIQANNETAFTSLLNYAWKGACIECPNCGEIFRYRQYWYANKSPEDTVVRSEIIHVWNKQLKESQEDIHSGQILLDGVNYISGAIGNVVSQPSKAVSAWVADKTAPSYWVPNSEIKFCHHCRKDFESSGLRKHHCRCCGQGFCFNCSKKKMSVPHRGWKENVRVCDECSDHLKKGVVDKCGIALNEGDITVRKYGEVVISALSQVAGVLEYPKDLIKDTARPSYWVKDADAPKCNICKTPFGTAEEIEEYKNVENSNKDFGENSGKLLINIWRHHCRECGQAVCDKCSLKRRPVPQRGWHGDVRVCDLCY